MTSKIGKATPKSQDVVDAKVFGISGTIFVSVAAVLLRRSWRSELKEWTGPVKWWTGDPK